MHFDSILKNKKIVNEFSISNISNIKSLIKSYKKLIEIRSVEEKIIHEINIGRINTPCHLSIGQEAIAQGISENYLVGDSIYSTHRSHAHYLTSGGTIKELFHELLGSYHGASRGMGGSMHLCSKKKLNFFSTPIVAGTIPISLGSALYYKKQKNNKNISICFFGDGASEEGVFHESMNIASNYDLPILFVCENNLYSSHLDIKLRQKNDSICRFANSFGIKSEIVNGNNIESIKKVSKLLISHIRKYSKPAFIEAVTFRLIGHVGPSIDIDVGVRRSLKEINEWKKKDPIKVIENIILNKNIINIDDINKLKLSTNRMVEKIFESTLKNFSNPKKNFLEKFKRNSFNA